MVASIKHGLRTAASLPKLTLLLWAWYGVLALVPAWPAFSSWNARLGTSPEAAAILARFDLGVLMDLTRGGGGSGLGPLAAVVAVVLGIAAMSGAFAFGGMLEVMGTAGERRSFMHRFARGGGHFFWRFVRLSVIAAACLILAAGLVSALVVGASRPLERSESEPLRVLAGPIRAAAFAAVAGFFLLALDYARIRAARDDARGMIRAYGRGIAFVASRLPAVLGMALFFGALCLGLGLGYVAYEANTPAAGTWGAIALLVAVMQAVVLGRVFLRVALVGAERHFDLTRRPSPVAAPDPAGVPGLPVAAPSPEPAPDPPPPALANPDA